MGHHVRHSAIPDTVLVGPAAAATAASLERRAAAAAGLSRSDVLRTCARYLPHDVAIYRCFADMAVPRAGLVDGVRHEQARAPWHRLPRDREPHASDATAADVAGLASRRRRPCLGCITTGRLGA